jgi:hypothetical protein
MFFLEFMRGIKIRQKMFSSANYPWEFGKSLADLLGSLLVLFANRVEHGIH